MPTKLTVIIVHGMGRQTETFADSLIADLEQRLIRAGFPAGTATLRSLFWAADLEQKEQALEARMQASGTLRWNTLRTFVLHNLGDAVAYRKTVPELGNVYDSIHDVVRRKLRSVAVEVGDGTPVVLLAHSLGGAIMSDYIWDRQVRPEPGESAMERLSNLVSIVTFGCNIPLFTLALPRVEPILLPSAELDARFSAVRPLIKWLNFYDPDDVLGWPLSRLYDTRRDGKPGPTFIDRDIEVGGNREFHNPLAHGAYWTDRDFVGPVADHLIALLRSLP